MVAIEHPEFIEERRWFIAMGVNGPDDVYENGSIDGGGVYSGEYDDSGSGEAGVFTGVIGVGENRWKRCSRL